MGQLAAVNFAIPMAFGIFDVQDPRRHAAATGCMPRAPDAIAHMGVGIVVDPGRAKVADKLNKLLDLLVAAGQVEGDFGDIVDRMIGDAIDLQIVFGQALLALFVVFGGVQFALVDNTHRPFDVELLQEL